MTLKKCLFLLSTFFLFTSTIFAEITLPKIIGHNMVLQQKKKVAIWGKAEASEKISVTFDGQNRKTVADQSGNWMVQLHPMKASFEPKEMIIKGSNTIVLKNILVGEVWLCSGQSNMEYAMRKYSDYQNKTKGYHPPEDDLTNAKNN